MTALRIRPGAPADAAAVARLCAAAFEPVARSLGYRPSPLRASFDAALEERCALLAELDAGPSAALGLPTAAVGGFAALKPRPASGPARGAALGGRAGGGAALRAPLVLDGALYVETLAVAPGARRRGVGRALIGAVERLASDLCLPAVTLHTDPRLAEAVRFYGALGFAPAGPPGPGVGPGPRQLFVKRVPTRLGRALARPANSARRG